MSCVLITNGLHLKYIFSDGLWDKKTVHYTSLKKIPSNILPYSKVFIKLITEKII